MHAAGPRRFFLPLRNVVGLGRKTVNANVTELAVATGTLLLLGGCGSGDDEQVSATTTAYYADLALPSVHPEGLSSVRVEELPIRRSLGNACN